MGNNTDQGIWYRKMSVDDYNHLRTCLLHARDNYGLDLSVINLLDDFTLTAGNNGYVYAPWDSISQAERDWLENDLIDLYDFEIEIGSEQFLFSRQPAHAF